MLRSVKCNEGMCTFLFAFSRFVYIFCWSCSILIKSFHFSSGLSYNFYCLLSIFWQFKTILAGKNLTNYIVDILCLTLYLVRHLNPENILCRLYETLSDIFIVDRTTDKHCKAIVVRKHFYAKDFMNWAAIFSIGPKLSNWAEKMSWAEMLPK